MTQSILYMMCFIHSFATFSCCRGCKRFVTLYCRLWARLLCPLTSLCPGSPQFYPLRVVPYRQSGHVDHPGVKMIYFPLCSSLSKMLLHQLGMGFGKDSKWYPTLGFHFIKHRNAMLHT